MSSYSPEARRAYMRDRYAKNRERLILEQKERRLKDPETYKATQRKHWMKKKYGLTPDKFNAMKDAQGGLCAICMVKEATSIDHDHMTGEVRKLLCGRCNSAIGLFDEVPDRIRSAAKYIEEHDSDYVDYSI